jgi:hypothetical protein
MALPLSLTLVRCPAPNSETHAIGKWNLGSKIKPLTPTRSAWHIRQEGWKLGMCMAAG